MTIGLPMQGFIIEHEEKTYLGFLVSLTPNKEPLLYLNTSPSKPWVDVLEILKAYIDENLIECKNFPSYIRDWAQIISNIKKGLDRDTSNIRLDYADYTPKQKIVIEVCIRQLKVNQFYSYSDVASMAGLPNAQRFVGTTMKKVRQPYIVPVHRVKSKKFIKGKTKTILRKMPL